MNEPTPPQDLSVFEKISQAKASAAEQQRQVRRATSVRRAAGALLGALLGVTAASVAPVANGWILLPGTPLDYGPWGAAGRVAFAAASGALIGGLTAWPTSSIWGVLLGDLLALAAGVARLGRSRVSSLALHVEVNPELYMLLMILGAIFVVTPVLIVVRLFSDVQGERRNEPLWSWARLRLLILGLLIAACLGTTVLNPPRRHQALLRMDAMIRLGRAASTPADLPAPLRDPARVGDFGAYAGRAYILQASSDPGLRAALDDNLSPFDQLVLARFSDRSLLGCLFKDGVDLVYCKRLNGP